MSAATRTSLGDRGPRAAWVRRGLITLLLLFPRPASAGEDLTRVQEVFRDAIRRATPATVVCRPRGVASARAGFSSGVLVHPRGLVLSDGDAGLVWVTVAGRVTKSWSDDVVVRLVGQPGAASRRGRVVARNRDIDASLIELVDAGDTPLPYVPIGTGAEARVGDFALALGTTFDDEGVTPPTLTAGLISALAENAAGDASGPWRTIYTSAAINQGVNGGPLISLTGRLVGTVSTYLDPEPDEPHPYLGKVVPIDVVRAAFAELAPMDEVVAVAAVAPAIDKGPAGALESTVRAAAHAAWPSVVSLEVKRRAPVRGETLLEESVVTLPRWGGPVTAVVADADGHVVTSLHNLTNLADRARPTWRPPEGADHMSGLADIEGATVWLAEGVSLPARFVGHDLKRGVGLFVVEHGADQLPPPLAAASGEALTRGRFVLALGNPYGAERPRAPLLTMGVLGKRHDDRAPAAWRGQWQTDAAVLDTSAGGPAVDLEGKVLGLLHLWHPARHGRGSGIAFIVPWSDVREAVAGIAAGTAPQPGVFGVWFANAPTALVSRTLEGGPAAAAGVRVGDRVMALDGQDVTSPGEARAVLLQRFAGETVTATIRRGEQVLTIDVVLAARE
ncbi:MAG: trypsin-like peptidase domain-containing protein [Planctomycetota bacterium]